MSLFEAVLLHLNWRRYTRRISAGRNSKSPLHLKGLFAQLYCKPLLPCSVQPQTSSPGLSPRRNNETNFNPLADNFQSQATSLRKRCGNLKAVDISSSCGRMRRHQRPMCLRWPGFRAQQNRSGPSLKRWLKSLLLDLETAATGGPVARTLHYVVD
jgi:hypothetical protein